ncbi:MAG: aminotransferase class IV [Candidatus Omnitrophota bacterium]
MNSIMKNFRLIESILWEDGGYFLLERHLDRIEKSAGYFRFRFDRGAADEVLRTISLSFGEPEKYKIRLLLDPDGGYEINSEVISVIPAPVKVIVSEKRIDKKNVFLYHKTTERALYDSELEKYRTKGFFDVIFLNQENEVTEGAVTNILIEKDGVYFTPPVSCGLLPGVYRDHLLRSQELKLEEKIIHPEDIRKAGKLFIINSVRKILPATPLFEGCL